MIEKAVLDFLNTLTPALRRRTLLAFDSDSRFAWHYVPRAHKGVLIKAMNDAQRDAAMAVLQAALSERGYERCQNIMRLETVVAEIEEDPDTYDPGNYALAIFGTPGSSAPWAWRIEGHHLALNFTHVADDIAVTPTFFGAQPATVEKGHLTGLRVLGEEEDNGRALIRSLDEAQRRQAIIRTKAFDDILTGPGRETSLREPIGLSLEAMAEAHRNIALSIIERFLGAMLPAVAEVERRALRTAGVGSVHFAWAGSLEPRQAHYYRLHGPSLVIEYDNTQDDANHIHSVWHNPHREFGADLLRQHYDHPSHAGGLPNDGRP
jgi:hypothetical protein